MLQSLPQALQGPSESELDVAVGDIRDSFTVLETVIDDVLTHPERRNGYVVLNLTDEQLAGLRYATGGLGQHVRELYGRINGDDPDDAGAIVALETVEA